MNINFIYLTREWWQLWILGNTCLNHQRELDFLKHSLWKYKDTQYELQDKLLSSVFLLYKYLETLWKIVLGAYLFLKYTLFHKCVICLSPLFFLYNFLLFCELFFMLFFFAYFCMTRIFHDYQAWLIYDFSTEIVIKNTFQYPFH